MGRLEGKVALVTGGAAGIGAAACRLLSSEGAAVLVTDIDPAAKRVADEIVGGGGRAFSCALDVTSQEAWNAAVETAVGTFGKLTVLVNNAGILLSRDVEDTTLDDWNRVMSVNATGVFLGMRRAIAAMKDSAEPCSIINHSSISGQVAQVGVFAYCASKGAVTLMTKSAALDCSARGYQIRVNSIHPGYIRTPMTEAEADDSGLPAEEFFAGVAAAHPAGRVGTPEDVGWLDVYLASDESLFVTGTEFAVDGGWTAQ